MRALLLIDLQNDFLPGGPLAVPGADAVISVANREMPNYDVVVATRDWHPPNHLSFASQHAGKRVGDTVEIDGLQQILWPDHGIEGSAGAEPPSDLNVERIDAVVHKGTDPRIDSYSGFFDNARRKQTGLQQLLRERGVDRLAVLGVATDYCVKFTALDAIDVGFETTLILDGIRGVNLRPGDSDRAITEMQTAGVRIG